MAKRNSKSNRNRTTGYLIESSNNTPEIITAGYIYTPLLFMFFLRIFITHTHTHTILRTYM